MNWRTWVRDTLVADAAVIAAVPAERIFSAGALTDTPATKPFIVIRTEGDAPAVPGAVLQDVSIWVHDYSGSPYTRIDEILEKIRSALEGPVAAQDGISANWVGDSPDLVDDARITNVRNSTYRMAGRRVA